MHDLDTYILSSIKPFNTKSSKIFKLRLIYSLDSDIIIYLSSNKEATSFWTSKQHSFIEGPSAIFIFLYSEPLFKKIFKALNIINEDLGEKFNKNDESHSTIESMIKNKSNDRFFNELLNHIYSAEEDIEVFKKILINIQKKKQY